MGCFSCFGSSRSSKHEEDEEEEEEEAKKSPCGQEPMRFDRNDHPTSDARQKSSPETAQKETSKGSINAQAFTFRELAAATKNFRPDFLLGEGGFGRVYKGCFESTGKVVAIKQLDRNGLQGNREFLAEVLSLSLLHHQNLVNLTGYCADGDQRLLVYEFIPMGSLDRHLLDIPPDQKPLSWQTRMIIAADASRGLEYLHEKANPPVIYGDLKSSNVLLEEDFVPKLADFGLARLAGDNKMHASTVMGTYGYCAPEYERGGELTLKSDVYSFGVILLELITGRKAVDTTKPMNEQNLVAWAKPMFNDQKRFPELADPRLQGAYPVKGLNQAVGVAAMCLQDEAAVRPFMTDVVMALSFLTSAPPDSHESPTPALVPSPPAIEHASSDHDHDKSDDDSSEHEHEHHEHEHEHHEHEHHEHEHEHEHEETSEDDSDSGSRHSMSSHSKESHYEGSDHEGSHSEHGYHHERSHHDSDSE